MSSQTHLFRRTKMSNCLCCGRELNAFKSHMVYSHVFNKHVNYCKQCMVEGIKKQNIVLDPESGIFSTIPPQDYFNILGSFQN